MCLWKGKWDPHSFRGSQQTFIIIELHLRYLSTLNKLVSHVQTAVKIESSLRDRNLTSHAKALGSMQSRRSMKTSKWQKTWQNISHPLFVRRNQSFQVITGNRLHIKNVQKWKDPGASISLSFSLARNLWMKVS